MNEQIKGIYTSSQDYHANFAALFKATINLKNKQFKLTDTNNSFCIGECEKHIIFVPVKDINLFEKLSN
ncbi:hypothetical protein [Clostridium tyrobutyricum]|uniref:hypothetical protein n=1 Tax=Clostridium tyrobutyricum TaxID=1519 RepID=UPI0011CB88EB|nr:hypothetical protein [Clostridium tyrobutyricum]